MCESQKCPPKDNILMPEAVEFGGSLFFGQSPISKQWLIARATFLMLSLMILTWSILYHYWNHKLIEWFYWINNWSLLLSSIYLSLSFIVTYKIYKFVNQQHSKLSSSPHSPYSPKSNMINETTSFAMQSPSRKKYKSIAQIDEDSIIQSQSNNINDEMQRSDQHSASLGLSVDENGIDKHSDIANNKNIIEDDEDNVSIASSASSYSSTALNLVKLSNDSDGTYNSFRIDKTHLHINASHSDIGLPSDYNQRNSVLFWLFTLKRMKLIGLSRMHKKFLQSVMALNMVSVVVYVAFIYEYNVDYIWNGMENGYQVSFSVFVNSGILMSVIMLFEYYSSALTMTYDGFVYPVFIGVSYCIMSVAISVSQFDGNDSYSNKIEIDNMLNLSIGKIYLMICCDWTRSPLHSLIHISSIIFILILFHFLFTLTKNVILSQIWIYYRKHNNDEDNMFDDDMYRTAMDINGAADGSGIQIIQKTEICDVNMDNIAEKNILLDASVSRNSTSIIELQYDCREIDIAQNLPILDEDKMANNIIIGDDDEYGQREGDTDDHDDDGR